MEKDHVSEATSGVEHFKTAKSLQLLAAETEAYNILTHVFPPSMQHLNPFVKSSEESCLLLCRILCFQRSRKKEELQKMYEECYVYQEDFVRHLVSVKLYWETEYLIQLSNNKCRRLVQDAILSFLLTNDLKFLNTLLNFTLQLVFCVRAGRFLRLSELPYQDCVGYSSVLENLAPFGIEEFYNDVLRFGSSLPVIAVLKNSPNLKVLHLEYNAFDDVVRFIPRRTKKVEKFVLGSICGINNISFEALVDCFFPGLNSSDVRHCVEQNQTVELGLPNLSVFLIDGISYYSEFILLVSHYYPFMNSMPFLSYIFSLNYLLNFVPGSKHSIKNDSCNLDDIIQFQDSGVPVENDAIRHIFDQITHIKLTEDTERMLDFQIVRVIGLNSLHSVTMDIPFHDRSGHTDLAVWFRLMRESSLGVTLKALQIFSRSSFYIQDLSALLSMMPQLAFFGLEFHNCYPEDNGEIFTFPSLKHLKSLYIKFESECQHQSSSAQLMRDLLNACPNMLYLECRISPYLVETLLQVCSLGLKHVRLFQLVIMDFELMIEKYSYIIQSLVSLEKLIVNSVTVSTLIQLQKEYQTSSLSIVYCDKSLLSYSGIINGKYV